MLKLYRILKHNYIRNNNFEKIYEKKGTTLNEKVQYPNISNSTNDTIPQFNNSVKLDNVSTKYSMQNNQNTTTWQEHLENNYQSAGTKTDMQDISKSNVLIQESKQQKADDFKYLPKPIKEVNKKKIENNTNVINRLEQEKKSLIERLENKIKDKQDLLKSKKNQDTKLATQLNMQISMLLYITQIIQDPKTTPAS